MRAGADTGQLDNTQSVQWSRHGLNPFVYVDALTNGCSHIRSVAAGAAHRSPTQPRAAARRGSLNVSRMSDSGIASLAPVDGLQVKLTDGVLSVTIDRPDSLNSLITPVITGLANAMEAAATDPGVRVVRLGGAGRGFCSGAGISADDMSGDGGAPPDEIILEINRLIRAITTLPHPVVAVVQGPAAGVGVSIALSCDVVLASEKAFFHARLHQDRPDARRWRVGVDRRRDRPGPGDADGPAARAVDGHRGARLGGWSPRFTRPRNSTPRWTR
ncbi:hypothetical protein IWGMT90018_49300 [Mycobacterium kiyosense]|nr:hypothetical protein IWGMT90018_49300 [Mycobacterium kiyosense]